MSGRLARLALSLYPLAFRRRYGAEMAALLDATPVGPLTVLDLLLGALAAHLRAPRGLEEFVDSGARVRASASGVLASWVVFAAAGLGFYKTTEDAPFAAAGNAHPVLGGAHLAVQVLAAIGSGVVVLGALPLVWVAIGAARREPRLRVLVSLPPAAVLVFIAVTSALVLAGGTVGRVMFIAWDLAALACAAVCVLAARAVLFALPVSPRLLLAAFRCATVVSGAMAGIAACSALYAISLAIDAPGLAGVPNGPWQLVSVGASLAAQLVVMAATVALAATSVRRGWRAAPRLPRSGSC